VIITKNSKLTYDDIVLKFTKIHGDLYGYSLIENNFSNVNSKIEVICKEHGTFQIWFKSHLRGVGCPICKDYKYTEELIERFRVIHGDLYDYSLIRFIDNSNKKISIICRNHGEYEQNIFHHLLGKGCPKCVGKNKTNVEIMDELMIIHKNKFVYPDILDIKLNARTNIKIICPEHGEFIQVLHSHKSGSSCPKCSKILSCDSIRVTEDKAIMSLREIHGDRYEYNFSNLKDSRSKILIGCKEHGWFEQTYHNHRQGSNCPKCSNNGMPSINEISLKEFIEKNYSGKIENNNREHLSGKEYDIYLPELKLAFEFNGLYWHNELHREKDYHLNKTEDSENNEIHLIHIYEDDWVFKQDIVKSRILNLLGKSKVIYGRKCLIKEVSSKESKQFLIDNHLMGSSVDKIRLGLYYQDELVSLMTFGKLRKNLGSISKEGSYELIRFCNKLNHSVVGGANKLFKHFKELYNPMEIISYADRSWTMNNGKSIYDMLNFSLLNKTLPNYHYINNRVRQNRFSYRKDVLVKEGYDKTKTEHEIMLDRKIYRIYDSGQLKFKY